MRLRKQTQDLNNWKHMSVEITNDKACMEKKNHVYILTLGWPCSSLTSCSLTSHLSSLLPELYSSRIIFTSSHHHQNTYKLRGWPTLSMFEKKWTKLSELLIKSNHYQQERSKKSMGKIPKNRGLTTPAYLSHAFPQAN